MPRVRFELRMPTAKAVSLVGDFNDWDPARHRMRRTAGSDGLYVRIVDLAPGRYEFRYIVDGEWVCCPSAPRVGNCYGSENSVAVVAAPRE